MVGRTLDCGEVNENHDTGSTRLESALMKDHKMIFIRWF